MVIPYSNAFERTRTKPYGETFRCPGGELCLDFCNTGQGARGSRQVEWISDYGELLVWLHAASAINAKQAATLRAAAGRSPEAAHRVWARAIAFREALARVLIANAQERKPSSEDVQAIQSEYARAMRYARLAPGEAGYRWVIDAEAEELDAALQPIVESALSLMTSPRMARLRRCGNATCFWLFIDETKNCSRRWCEMASCGNVMKVRRHRARIRKK